MMRGIVLVALVVCALGATAWADNKQLAKDAYTEGKRHYDLGEYGDALAAFKKAYLNYEEPVFLFNIAQCYRQIGDRPGAVRTYRAFLRNWPKAPNRETVERIISELETAIALDVSAKAAPPQDTLPPPATATTKPKSEPQVASATQPKPAPTTAPPPATTAPPATEPKAHATATPPAEPKTAPEPAKVATKPKPPSRSEYTEMVEVEPNFDRPSGQSKPLKWWAWTLIAVGVGGVIAVAVVIAITQSGGNFKSTLPDFTVTGQAINAPAPRLLEVRF